MARPKSNHTIDYRCITIGVNGEGINGLVNKGTLLSTLPKYSPTFSEVSPVIIYKFPLYLI